MNAGCRSPRRPHDLGRQPGGARAGGLCRRAAGVRAIAGCTSKASATSRARRVARSEPCVDQLRRHVASAPKRARRGDLIGPIGRPRWRRRVSYQPPASELTSLARISAPSHLAEDDFVVTGAACGSPATARSTSVSASASHRRVCVPQAELADQHARRANADQSLRDELSATTCSSRRRRCRSMVSTVRPGDRLRLRRVAGRDVEHMRRGLRCWRRPQPSLRRRSPPSSSARSPHDVMRQTSRCPRCAVVLRDFCVEPRGGAAILAFHAALCCSTSAYSIVHKRLVCR